MFGNHGDRQAHQGAHVGSQRAVGAGNQHHVVFHGQAGHDLCHARVFGAGQAFYLAQKRDLGGAVQSRNRVLVGVERAAAGDFGLAHAGTAGLRGAGDGAHGARGVEQRGLRNIVGIGKSGFLAADRTHAHALVDAERAGFDNTFFQAPALGAGVLEVEVGLVHALHLDFGQRARQVRLVQAKRGE